MISFQLHAGQRVNVRNDLGAIVEMIYRGCTPARDGSLIHFVSHSAHSTAVCTSVPLERIAPLGTLPHGQPAPAIAERARRQAVRNDAFAARMTRLHA